MAFNDNIEIVLSNENKIERQANRVRRTSLNAYEQLKQQYEHMYKLIWENPQGVTPQEMFTCFGVDGQDLLDFMDAMENTLIATDNGFISLDPSDGVHPTENQGDGSINVL